MFENAYYIKNNKVFALEKSYADTSGSGREDYHCNCSPIGEQLMALGVRPDFIVTLFYRDDDNEDPPFNRVTIYKNSDDAQTQTEYELTVLDSAYAEIKAAIQQSK